MSGFVGFYNHTVIATYLGFGCGMAGLCFAAAGDIRLAMLSLLFAGFFDLIDGKIARACKTRSRDEKRFGVQIDSLSDEVCFGVLPAMIAVALSHSLFTILIAILYALAGLIRLGFFNVLVAAEEEQGVCDKPSYHGLPISTAGILFPLLYLLRPLMGESFLILYLVMLVVTGFAFLAPFQMAKPGGKGFFIPITAVGAITLAMLLYQTM